MSHPYKETRLSETKWIRTFSQGTQSDELVWHRDREDRVVRAVNGSGWALQLDGELPRPIRLGESYRIPAEHWHRLVRRPDATALRLVIEKKQKGDELRKGMQVKAKGKKSIVIVPDARGDLVGVDPAGADDMDMVPSDEIEPIKEKKEKKKYGPHPKTYGAPEGSKRDEMLDKTKADLESGDPEREQRAWARRERMEKKEREKSGWENKPRPDTKTESSQISESDLRHLVRDVLEEELSKKTKATLRKKAEDRGLTPGSVEAEYKKGLAAYGTSGSRKGMSQHQWAMARVNAATPSKDWATVKKSKAKKKRD